MYMYLTDLW